MKHGQNSSKRGKGGGEASATGGHPSTRSPVTDARALAANARPVAMDARTVAVDTRPVAADARTDPANTHPPEVMPFALWQNLRARLIWIYEGRPMNTSGRAQRSFFAAWCIREGELTLRPQGAAPIKATRGQWLLLPPGQDERSFSAEAKILSVNFDACWVTGEHWLAINNPILLEPERTENWYRAALPMLRIVRRDFASAYNALPATAATFSQYTSLQAHFLNWLNAIAGAALQAGVHTRPLLVRDERALHMRDYLETLPLEQGLRVEQLASAFGLSVSQLNRIFYAHFGLSPRSHYEALRYQRAMALLGEGDAPIKEIAFALGFRHTSQLSSWFRTKHGCSPLQYRLSTVQDTAK